ncbi:MAG: glycosyltransferase [Microbispora sp.]|nr:glycosyltransferase [Microbispora sp.]
MDGPQHSPLYPAGPPASRVAFVPPPRAVGFVERLEADHISGWAWVPEEPAATVQVEVFFGDRLVARLAADGFRPDLLASGRGTGRYGFALNGVSALFEAGRELVSVRFSDGGVDLHGSPRWVQVADRGLDPAVARFLEAAVASAAGAATRPEELDVLLTLLTRLLGETAAARAARRGDGRTALDEVAEAGAAAGRVAELAQEVRRRFPPLELPPPPAAPRVSIVIPAHGKFELTYGCIAAIARVGAAASFEVILLDDGSADETLLADFVFGDAVRVLRQRRNTGFVHAANAGAAAARGEYLLFLNNDTEVQDGWLDELLQTFDRMPEVGVAGAKLIYPDGRLQEAGGIVGRFGEAVNWGNGQDPDEPRFRYLRDADYVSAAALMIPRALFERLGGFDEEFAPGYYEDTDLCFRVRERAGRRVVVQPHARVLHLEGGTAGRDTGAPGPKQFQVANQRKFFRRWQAVLARHCPLGGDAALAAERLVARRALFIDENLPTPDRDAGSNAAFEHMRLLLALGYKVSFLPAQSMARRDPYAADLERIGIEVLCAPYVNSVEDAFRRQPVPPDLVYLHRGSNAAKYTGLVREYFPEARLVYSVADLHFLRLRREAEVTGDPARLVEAARCEAAELHAVRSADRVIVHSHVEAAMLRQHVPEASVHVVPWTVRGEPPVVPLPERSGLAFIGGYAHRPNVDAALHLVAEVMPAAWAALPSLHCLLVGSDMPREVARLAGPGVKVLGHVPDLREVFARIRCTVAPLRYGAGIKGKVLTSLAHGVPCVMTPIAAEGVAFPETLRWLIAETPAQMAERVVTLHRDEALAAQLSEASLAFARESFGEATVLRLFAGAIGEAAGPAGTAPQPDGMAEQRLPAAGG